MKKIRFLSFLSCLLGYTCLIAQHKIRCKETGYYKNSLKVCFTTCIQSLLEEECSEDLKGFSGNIEFRLVISIPQERILSTQLLVNNKENLSPKQRLKIKKTLRKVPLMFIGKENNTRQALNSFPYKTSWVYSVQNGHFVAL